MNPDADAQRLAHELNRDIKRDEGKNYVGVKIIRDPTPRYAFNSAAAAPTRSADTHPIRASLPLKEAFRHKH